MEKYIFIIITVLFFGGIDYMFVAEVVNRGGWAEYCASNPFAGSAIAYMVTLNVIFVMMLWVGYICSKD